MRTHHVGDVVVVTNTARGRVPVGIVTDRDLAIEILAENIDPNRLTVGDVMTPDLVTAPEDQTVFDTIQQMQHHGIRRLPIVDRQGCLAGIVTVDDLSEFLTMQLGDLTKAVASERRREACARS
jgi:CBS domain-containing protein